MAWNIRSYFKEESMAKIISFIDEFKKSGSNNPELDAFNKFMEVR